MTVQSRSRAYIFLMKAQYLSHPYLSYEYERNVHHLRFLNKSFKNFHL